MRRDTRTAKEDMVVQRLKHNDSVNVNVLKPESVAAQGQGT